MLEALAALILIAAVAAVLHFRWGFFRRTVHPWLEKNAKLLSAYSSIVGILLAPAILIGGYVAFMQIRDHLDAPDLVFVFASPDDPRFWVQNPSSKLAPEAQYQLLLFNLSAEGEHGWYLNLEIPTKSVGYIRPGRARGPWAISSVARQGASIGVTIRSVRVRFRRTISTCSGKRSFALFGRSGSWRSGARFPLLPVGSDVG